MRLSLSLLSVFLTVCIGLSKAQDKYDGHYDLKARDAAYLCVLMDDYLKTGKQPDLAKSSPQRLEKSSFLKGKPCWRFTWNPCDDGSYTHTNQRPCGWYQMEKAPDTDCN